MRLAQARCFFAVLMIACIAAPAMATDEAHIKRADDAIAKGIEYLKSVQNEDGSWSPQPGPAITALIVTAMLDQPDISASDPAVMKGVEYILSKAKPDGGIHDGILYNYNTAICLSALARVNDLPGVSEVIQRGEAFLRGLQWSDQPEMETGGTVAQSHPFWGGFGYGKHGRPDGSNTYMAVQAFADMGVDCTDPAVQRALAFVSRLQGTPGNDLLADRIVPDGGSIYATTVDKDHMDTPQSMAGEVVGEDGVTRLRTYGSMTYAMFRTYIYAQLPNDDPRVVDAVKWISNNYTLEHNPGMPEERNMQGYYYYLVTFSRAMKSWTGSQTMFVTPDGQTRNWGNDLVAKVTSLQRDDGSWTNDADRWMEGDPQLVTAYALIALTQAAR